jgi:hypothetical protein
MQLRPKPCNFATLMTYDVFRVCYLFESLKHKYSSAFEDKYEMKSCDDPELTSFVLCKIDKNTIIIKQYKAIVNRQFQVLFGSCCI